MRPGFRARPLAAEFLQRADGWPALSKAYGAGGATPIGLDHGLAYDAVAAGRVDVIDVYSTDAELGRLGLTVLEDDRAFFPKYDAVAADARGGRRRRRWQAPRSSIDAATMIAMNAEVELDGRSFAETAQQVPRRRLRWQSAAAASGRNASGMAARAGPGAKASLVERIFAPISAGLAAQHLLLVFGSLVLAVALGVPLGIAARGAGRGSAVRCSARWRSCRRSPSLALLAFLIALVGGIGVVPARDRAVLSTRSCRSCATPTPACRACRGEMAQAARRSA